MTKNISEVAGIFPIPIAKVTLQDDFTNEIEFLKAVDMRQTDGGYYSHMQSDNTYILELSNMKRLKDYILVRATEYMQNVLAFTEGAQLTQSWVNKNSPGEGTHLHAHPNSIVSGVFYMDVPEGTGHLRFHKNKTAHTSYYMEPQIDPSAAAGNFWAYDFVDVPVATGELILFPSWVTHSVEINNTSNTRWCVAFNMMPEWGLGERRNLSEMVVCSNDQLDLTTLKTKR